MEILDLPAGKFNKTALDLAVKILKNGGVIVSPTDTVYGFAARADCSAAINKIRRIKKRSSQKPLIILVSSLKMAQFYCRIPASRAKQLSQVWRGKRPTSVIFNSRGRLANNLEITDSLALRLPQNDFLRTIIRRLKIPLASTSFNFSGQALIDPLTVETVFKKTNWRPDLVIRSNQKTNHPPSKLLDWRFAEIKVLRQ